MSVLKQRAAIYTMSKGRAAGRERDVCDVGSFVVSWKGEKHRECSATRSGAQLEDCEAGFICRQAKCQAM